MTKFPIRTIKIGGHTKTQLMEKLQLQSIAMNEYAKKLLTDDKFTTTDAVSSLQIIEVTVKELRFSEGATLPQIYERANELGMKLCPLELGPHLRLVYLDQQVWNLDNTSNKNQAPYGSITVASEIISKDDEFPKGFYLRKINGVLNLRGYIADDLHIWNPDGRFIFCLK